MQTADYIDLDAICLVKPEMVLGTVWSHDNSTQQKGAQIGPEIACLFGKKQSSEV